ncbi:MAG TPA: DUF1697 domain-containing protein [Opitutaceae bacterium]|nr:DUF1697 domain-containing protein [Opitutaceae bacterium]
MPHYAALLRGIGPTNPAMRNEKLCAVLAGLGCRDIRALLGSGNLVFESAARSPAALETKIEQALSAKLGLSLDVLVRTREELEAMVKADPFRGAEHGREWYLTVTFFKDRRDPLYSKLDRATLDGPKFMTSLGKRHGKHITTRTWKTVKKIVAMMNAPRSS